MRVRTDRRRFYCHLGLLLAAVLLLTTRCSFKKNQSDHPYPSEARVSKAFFEETDSHGRARLKTFIAGWAPEMSSGERIGAHLVHYNHAEHMNVVFEIEENRLIGKKIIASFVENNEDCFLRDSEKGKQCRSRWPNIITIPITSHFYYERSKDPRGRETDIFVENESRSHWSARPFMNLELSGVNINDWSVDLSYTGLDVDGVEDIEWDPKTGYLGFTLEARNKGFFSESESDTGSQGKFRYNFLEFKHDPTFKQTPYRHANAKHLNVLHVIGKEIGGDPANPVMYAARWDTRKKHTIYLHGFPEEYEKIARDVIEEWNDAFEKIGHGRPFLAEKATHKYAFDLRYPTITWVDDRRLSAAAPLGVGMALADVRNGEIRWGGVTLWGGMLQEYINRSSPNAAAAGLSASLQVGERRPIVQLGLMEPKRLLPGVRSAVPESLLGLGSFESIRSDLTNQFARQRAFIDDMLKSNTPDELMQMAKAQPTEDSINPISQMAESLADPNSLGVDAISSYLQQKEESLETLLDLKRAGTDRAIIDEMASGLTAVAQRMNLMATQIGPLEKVYNADYIQGLISMPKLSESLAHLPVASARTREGFMRNSDSATPQDLIDVIQNSRINTQTGLASFCTDRRFHDQIESYAMGIAQANIDKVEAMRAVVKDLLLHEIGHMLGMGHNFKENILPERGSVPNVSQAVGLYKPFSMDELEKQAHDLNKNYTTVMGYKDGAVDVLMKYEDLVPGPNDILVMEYLYNQRYPIYPVDAKGEGDFKFVRLTNDGWILENIEHEGKTYRPAFFPACNDITATRGDDPYCARWDRGYNASTIVQNHFDSYRGNLISQLTAFTDTVKGDNYRFHEYYLWIKSLRTFSRVRVFYDYMRQKYEPEIRQMVASGSEAGIQNLLQFADTCRQMREKQKPENAYLENLFKGKPELLDLCVAGGIMVSELNQLMQLPGKDYTQIDYKNRFSSLARGGEARFNFSRVYGTWKELARIPIKFSALMTLTAPYAYAQYGGWSVPITEYARPDGAYHISTLYSKDYTMAIASGAEMNLNLGNSGIDENTSIGRTVMAMGYYLNNTWYSNDVLTVGAPFVQNIRNQTAFRYSYAIVDVERDPEEAKPIARKFSGTIFNFYSRGPEKVPEMYIYTNDRVVMRPPPGSLMMPLTPVRWYSKTGGYFYAMKMDFADEFFDRLKTNSVRRTLNETYQNVIKKCVQGENRNGLRFFFNKDVSESVFPGFDFPDTIAEREDSKNMFLRSVESQFERYYSGQYGNFSPVPTRAQCEEALRGQALIVMAASVLNGYYFFELYDYLEKDMSW